MSTKEQTTADLAINQNEQETLENEKKRLDSYLYNLVNWFYKRRVILLIICIIAFAIISSVYAYFKYEEHLAYQRGLALYQIEKPLSTQGDTKEVEAKITKKLEDFVVKYQGTKESGVASLRLAGFYQKNKQIDKEEQSLKQAVQSFSTNDSFYLLGISLLSNFYFDNNKKEKALDTILKIPAKQRTAFILMQTAQFYKAQGKKKEAIAQLEVIRKKYPNSAQFATAETLLDELKS